MSGRVLQKHLEILQTIFTNALTEDSAIAKQPSHITVPLRMHQLAVLEEMEKKERALQIGLSVETNEGQEVIYSDYAILGDRVGIGKTLMVLGHISQMSGERLQTLLPQNSLHEKSTRHMFSLSVPRMPTTLFDNLIIVPHTLFRQWQDTIQNQTNLTAFFCKTQRDLDKDDFLKKVKTNRLTLISNTLLPWFLHHLRYRLGHEPRWIRVFFDEADAVKIPSTCEIPQANMTWFITATFPNLLFSNDLYQSYITRQLPETAIESFHPNIQEMLRGQIDAHPMIVFYKMVSHPYFIKTLQSQHPLRGHLVITCENAFLNESVQLPPLHRRTILCQSSAQHQLIANIVPTEIATMLHAGDTEAALQALGVSSHTPLTLVEAVTGYKQKELDRLKRLFEFKKEEEYSTPQAKEEALKNLEERIQKLEEQIHLMKERIEEVSKDSCSICYESGDNPLLTPCCSKKFCAQCILEWMTRVPKCPLCREAFHPSSLVSLSSSNVVTQPIVKTALKPKKIEALQQILRENPDGQFLIFSRFENPFHDIERNITEQYPVAYLQGNKDVISKTLQRFESGDLKILFLNSRTASAGMNIPKATHLVLLHKMGSEEEKQILGRAYRLGRTKPLEMIYLLNDVE
jgi:SNF2 family DNA or RNA helicase